MRTRTTLARVYATAAHAAVGQRRKYTDQPYIVHPIRVAEIVDLYGGTDDMISAAYLHDVVEDTAVSIDDINDMFVKCADIIDNAGDIGDHDPSFNVVYRQEMLLLLGVLDEVKDTLIYQAAVKAVTLK